MNTNIKFLLLSILFLNISNIFSFDCDYITQTDTIKPKEFYLGKIYPQPFSMPYYIEFGISDSSIICINMYNINGDTLRERIRCKIQGGNYRFNWNDFINIPGATSGIYFITMNATNTYDTNKVIFTDNKKVLIVK